MPRLLLITYKTFLGLEPNGDSRPRNMYGAFLRLGYSVSLYSGLQGRRPGRWSRLLQKLTEIKKAPPDFCYLEAPKSADLTLCDYLLLFYMHKKKIPIGCLYRDARWRFPKSDNGRSLTELILQQKRRLDLFILNRTAKVMFFPTRSMAGLFKFRRKCVLPPAGSDFVTPEHETARRALYVGQISELCGTDILLGAFEIINRRMLKNITLTVCCHEEEMGKFFEPFRKEPWLEVVNDADEAYMRQLYEQSDVALYPARHESYMDYCMPSGLFGYLSRALPIVTTNTTEAARFVLRNGIGVVAQDNPGAFAAAVISLVDDSRQIQLCRANAKRALRLHNLWEHRAKRAAAELLC
jgi:glycosyltransferase involved in cell wall biosynthesis